MANPLLFVLAFVVYWFWGAWLLHYVNDRQRGQLFMGFGLPSYSSPPTGLVLFWPLALAAALVYWLLLRYGGRHG